MLRFTVIGIYEKIKVASVIKLRGKMVCWWIAGISRYWNVVLLKEFVTDLHCCFVLGLWRELSLQLN